MIIITKTTVSMPGFIKATTAIRLPAFLALQILVFYPN
jgi:hypothetical protein